jgi:cephalosporin-C deacetylase-like acetyl esterase
MTLRIALTTLILTTTAIAEDNPHIVLGDGHDRLIQTHLNQRADELIQTHAEQRNALDTPEELAAYQQKQRDFFEQQLGGFPERTPLNARVTGTLERDGFTVEKVVFESRPNFYVTANLYLPTGEGPFPGVLVPCGHSANGKASELYQRASILLALNGMAALCYDPIGQGERAQILKDDGTQMLGSTLEHTMVGVGSILVGANTSTYRVWDGMRAIDYLQSRPEIDGERIGCTGNSGGGTLTSFLMSLDERIDCAAPSCYLTSFERLLDTEGPQDAEQNWYAQLAHGFDHAEYIITRAPKPTLICAATQDFFDIDGTWDTFRAAKRWYTKLGYPERVTIAEVDQPHGFHQGLREAAVQWMARWLLDRDEPVREPAFEVFTDEELQVTEEGQVLVMDGAISVFDINTERGEALAKSRAELHKNLTQNELKDEIKETVGFRTGDDLPDYEVVDHGEANENGVMVKRIAIASADAPHTPAIQLIPETPSGDHYLIVHGEGKAVALAQGGLARQLVNEGHTITAIDLYGIGELETPENYKGWAEYFSRDWQDYYAAYLIGESFVGMRTEQILQTARAIQTDDKPIHLIATGEATVPALHATAFESERFASTVFKDGLETWTELLGQRITRNQLFNTVHGALRVYDLPDLRTMLE